MQYENFYNLCKYLGDQSLPEADRWKSLKYINIAGQATPGFDFQRLIKEERVNFIKNTDIGAGFTIIDASNAEFGVTNINDPILLFIPLESVDSFTFIVTKSSSDGSDIISIDELTEEISGNTEYDIPVNISFTHTKYYFKVNEELKFPVIFSRKITSDNYEVKYQDNLGNELSEKPSTVGEYYLLINCINGYTRSNRVKFEIQL